MEGLVVDLGFVVDLWIKFGYSKYISSYIVIFGFKISLLYLLISYNYMNLL